MFFVLGPSRSIEKFPCTLVPGPGPLEVRDFFMDLRVPPRSRQIRLGLYFVGGQWKLCGEVCVEVCGKVSREVC